MVYLMLILVKGAATVAFSATPGAWTWSIEGMLLAWECLGAREAIACLMSSEQVRFMAFMGGGAVEYIMIEYTCVLGWKVTVLGPLDWKLVL